MKKCNEKRMVRKSGFKRETLHTENVHAKKWKVMVVALSCLAILAGCGGFGDSKKENETNKEEEFDEVTHSVITIAAADAEMTEGEKDGVKQTPEYDAEHGVVKGIIQDASVKYTVPDGVDGTYDIYLEIGKTQSMVGCTIYDIVVNDADRYVLPTDIVRANPEQTDLYDMGTFLMAKGVKLKSGDVVAVVGKSGYTTIFNEKDIFCAIPAIGDMKLYEAGSVVAVGYGEGEVPEKEETDSKDALSGKTICWLGSSVTYGAKAEGYSMADAIAENHKNTTCLKYTISGTTLANSDASSYVARMKSDIDTELDMDVMIVQLSTNDAKQGKEMGIMSDSRRMEDFDDATIIGAMEAIIAYTQETWGCPVIFYTGTRYESEEYAAMVEALHRLQDKWGIGVIDLWENEEMTAIIGTEAYDSYMADDTHPNEKGYKEWWAPEFESYLTEYFTQK